MPKPTALRALTSFTGPDRRAVTEGTILTADDPIVKGREHLFETVDDHIEQATAAPGEKREVAREHDCPVEGCDYTGTKRGLKIHTGQVHDDES